MSMDQLITSLEESGALQTPRIIAAFRMLDRKYFVSPDIRSHAYRDAALPTDEGQTISQPYTVALMLELLQPQRGDRCLDIGTGSGWVAGLLAYLVGDEGTVLTVERHASLTQTAKHNLTRFKFTQLEFAVGDASHGWPERAPYDVIHVAAATRHVPKEFMAQLSIGGRMIIPVGEDVQDLAFLVKTGENEYRERRRPGFQFVPLIDERDTT